MIANTPAKPNTEKYFRFFITLIVVVLLNLAGSSLFFRADMTRNGIYSLSEDSQKVVSTLSEPMTIKIFFTRNLPAPHNNTEQYIHDLLNEYARYGGRHFNYRFYDVSADVGDSDQKAAANQKNAEAYGIFPVQIQHIENDEIKFQKAYMGMVLIHGDLIERIPTISGTEGLEYKITSAIRKLNNKVSALLRLKEKIQIRLYLSSSLNAVASYIQLKDVDKLPKFIEETVDARNAGYFNKLEFKYLDPSTNQKASEDLKKYNLPYLKWPAMEKEGVAEGQGTICLVMTRGEKSVSIPLINVVRLPLVGSQYSVVEPDKIGELIEKQIDSLVDINADIGYLVSHGVLNPSPRNMFNPVSQRDTDDISFFRHLISQNYTLREVDLKSDFFPEDFNCLIIARPLDQFSDLDLFKIDQFLMKGKSLALFLDRFRETPQSPEQPFMNQGASFTLLSTGLDKLLSHYGIEIKPSIVMDKNCFNQQIQTRFGGGERPIYFAPIIKNEKISHDLDFMKNIKELVIMNASPLQLLPDTLKNNDITAHRLFASSDASWEAGEPLNLNPLMIRPPISDDQYKSFDLAYLLEGGFPSYFAGRPMPEKETEKEEKPAADQKKGKALDTAAKIKEENIVLQKGKPGKILLIASSELLKNNLLDEEGQSPNATFLLNVIDALNGREETAVMRAKEQQLNPLGETGAAARAFVKFFNIIGLPVMVVAAGMIVWFFRYSRKKKIRAMFAEKRNPEG